MTTKYSTKKALISSIVVLALCFSMLIGTTFAWFTDSASSTGNVIKTGTLDVEMYYADGTKDVPATVDGWTNVTTGGPIFYYENWEPGYAEVRHVKIENNGSLAIKYKVLVVADGEVSDLADVIDVYYVDPAVKIETRDDLALATKLGTLTDVLENLGATAEGTLVADTDDVITLALVMQEDAGNEYMNKSIGTTFTVKVLATQLASESDSFGNDYDAGAEIVIASGTSNDISWTLTEAGPLAISGDSVISAADIQSLSANASQITNVKIGSSITEIGEEAFRGLNISAVTFEDNAELEKIGTNAFRDCVALETVEIPASVETISEKAFQGCASLETLTFDANSQLKTVGAGKNAFANCTSLKSVVLPDSVETLGVACFYGCTSLETVVLGDNVTSIGASAFENSGVTAFEVPSALTVIPNNMLKNTKITTITVGDQVTTVNPGAFENCTELKTAYIGSATIKESVFAGCSNLETVIFANVTNLDGWAFMNCTNLKTVVINAENNLTLGYNTYTTGAKANWYGNTYYSATGNVITYIASAIDGVYSEQCENCLLGHGWNDGTADGTDILAYTNGGTFANDTTFADGTLATPTKAGYVFGGWYTESDFSGTAVTTAVAGQIYYAQWIAE